MIVGAYILMKKKKLNKVGLIDSGVTADYQYGKINRIKFSEDDDGYDSTGHGTLCASMILKMNPNAEIYSVKGFDINTSCSSDRLLKILNMFREIDVDIINMSLSTQDMARIDDYSKACNALLKQEKLLVASLSNTGLVSLPAMLPSVIGVGGCDTFFDNDYIFFQNNKIECFFDSKPVMLRNIVGDYELFGGNSKACAALSGLLSSIELQSNENIVMTVRSMLSDINMKKIEYEQSSQNIINKNKEDDSKIKSIVMRVIGKDIDYGKVLFEQFSSPSDATRIVEALENEYKIYADYRTINLYDFTSIASLIRLVYNKTTICCKEI